MPKHTAQVVQRGVRQAAAAYHEIVGAAHVSVCVCVGLVGRLVVCVLCVGRVGGWVGV